MDTFKINGFILALGFIISAYFLLRRNPRLKLYLSKLGGPPSLPILGCTLSFLRPHCEYLPMFGEFVKRYGLIFGFWIGNCIPYVVVGDANVIEKLLSSTKHIEKGKNGYSLLYNWLGTGLLTAPTSKWIHRRKLLTPTFHFKILEDFMPIFNEQATVLLDCLEKGANNDTGNAINIYPYISRCTLDIICETAMGKKIYAQTGEGSSHNKLYMDAVNGMCSLLMEKSIKPWFRIPLIYFFSSTSRKEKKFIRIMKQFTEEVIRARKSERICNNSGSYGDIETEADSSAKLVENKNPTNLQKVNNDGIYGKKRKAFLDLLLDVSQSRDGTTVLTDTDIREETDTFMFEGFDTTASSVSHTIFLLAYYQESQDLLHNELDEVFGDDETRDVTTADLPKLKYLDSCLKESLRLYPSVPLILRHMEADLKLDNGKTIPKGATALITIYYAHRNPEFFPEPEKFKPERFLEENQPHKKNSYSYIPFSAGARNCIGQKFAMTEEKVVLAKLFRKFKMKAVDKVEDLKIVSDLVLRCENGFNVILSSRNNR